MKVLCWVALGVCFLMQVAGRFLPAHQFAVMPIFTPVSLQYEKQIRNGEEPLNIRQAMEILHSLEQDVTKGNIREEDLRRLRDTRSTMLSHRNRRHELNIEMMQLSVELVNHLEPKQWDVIQSQRDAIQAKIELQIFDDLLQRLK